MTELEYIEWMRRYILVHSRLYYEMDTNVVSDKEYDKMGYELAQKQKDIQFHRGMYWDVFSDFDGTTGFDLFGRLTIEEQNRIDKICHAVLRTRF